MAEKGIPYNAVKDPRVINESCWKAVDDNLLPNPPFDLKWEEDEAYVKASKKQSYDTKVIMAHEFRENPEGFQSIAQTVADSYNDQHKLRVGEDLPIGFEEEK